MRLTFLFNGLVQLIISIGLYMNMIEMGLGNRIPALALAVLAIISLLFYKNYQESDLSRYVFLSFMFYNAASAMISYSSSPESFPLHRSFTLIHLALFVIFFMSYMKSIKSHDFQ